MIIFISLLFQIGQQCTFSCDTCSSDLSCLSCNPTRELVNKGCECINSFMEVNGNHCFQCSSSCGKCNVLDQQSCVDCGNQTLYHRILNSNNQCECEQNYQEVSFSFACFDISFSKQMYQFQYILQQEQYIKRLQQKYNYSQATLSGMQYLISQGLVYNSSKEEIKKYQRLSLIKRSELFKMDLPYFPTGEYYAELHENAYMMAIQLDANQVFDWAANVFYTDYIGYPSQRNDTWNIHIFQFKLKDYKNEIFLQIAISQKKSVIGSRLLSEATGNMTLAYYLGYTQADYFNNSQLEDIINDIMFVVLERPINSDEYSYNGTDIIIKTCKQNYKLIDGICVCGQTLYKGECYLTCPQECKTCTQEVCILQNGTIICRDGYYMDDILHVCLKCSNECLTCSAYQSCKTCPTGLILVDDKCLTCQKYWSNSLCLKYDDKCECTGCITGYQLNIQSCIPCPINCKSCEFENKCIVCVDGYYLENEKCNKCQDHCYKCNSQDDCFSCGNGYYIDTGKVYPCNKNCLTYGESCICVDCPTKYYLSTVDHDCHACQSPCLTCTTQDNCLTCVSDSYYIDDTLKKCPHCVSPCLTCESSGKCKTCLNNEYYLSNLQECVQCPTPMKQCQKQETVQCITCKSTYYCFQGYCYHCPPYCTGDCYLDEILKDTQCDDCIKGYFKSQPNIPFICKQCPTGCSDCESETQCISCLQGYKLINGICIKCSKYNEHCIDCNDTECIKCENPYIIKDKDCYMDVPIVIPICLEGTFYNVLTNKCDNCLITCKSCLDSQTCSSCPDGYFLEKGQCVQCRLPCKLCSDNKTCTSTQDGYYIGSSNGSINTFKCIPPCLTCISEMECIICVDGYYFIDGKCILCDTNCKTCKNLSTTCTSCPKGYQLVNNKCEKCIDDACQLCNTYCSTCNHLLDELYVCFECLPGYLKVDQKCIPCNSSCKTCLQTVDQCTSCPPHYYLTKDMICLPCDTGCNQCQIQTKSCLVCDDGLQLVENSEFYYKCIKCQVGCETCDLNHCIKCKEPDYYLTELGQCKQCESPCKTCLSKTQCITCVDGFYQDGESCKPCSEGCKECSSHEECIACQVGYYLDGKVCQKCPDNCSSCTSSNECGGCVNGYYLDHLCIKCSEPCSKCTKDVCLDCEKPYKIQKGQCIQDTLVCIANCKQCSNTTECIVCDEQYTLSSNFKSCDFTTINEIAKVSEESSSNSSFGVIIGIVGAMLPLGILAKYTIDRCRYNIRPRKPERKKQRLQDLIQSEPSLMVV